MAASVHLIPAECPGCGAPVETPDPRCESTRRNPLFLPLLILSVVAAIGATVVSFWWTGELTYALTSGRQLFTVDRGFVYFVLFAASLAVIVWLFRMWWRLILRLPRSFNYECPSCQWSGRVGIVDLSALIGSQLPLVERGVEFKGDPRPLDPIEAGRERLERRIEQVKRIARDQELSPDPEFGSRDP